MVKKYYPFILLAFFVIALSSCQKGGEPVPFSKVTSSESNTSNLRSGDPSVSGDGDGTGTIIGGDDNEDDDDGDNTIGGDDIGLTPGGGGLTPGGGH